MSGHKPWPPPFKAGVYYERPCDHAGATPACPCGKYVKERVPAKYIKRGWDRKTRLQVAQLFLRDLVMGVWHLLAYIPRGIAQLIRTGRL